ncbi:sigma-70 family RNA polymerase sigma factor [Kocuria coralli]|uniref:sigma-70 family RNA polymerase sigma factor n=1 Tax=Kocuria coralli TaxID=1461025 RepID=UPI0015F2B28D|nr:sigma-70 family RNA polymerase sigma factor [Kocuria coralli]
MNDHPAEKQVLDDGTTLSVGRPLDLSPEQYATLNTRVLGVAYRMLGSWSDAEDVASRTWMRWHTSRPDSVREPAAWLTTVATRISLDLWRTATRRREDYIGPWLPDPVDPSLLPEESTEQRETLTMAMMHLMERLTPDERAIYVLRNAFGYNYPEIAEMVGRTPAACRQLRHRAQLKLGELPPHLPAKEQRTTMDRLVSAILEGRVADAIALVSADAVLITDGGGRTKAALRPVMGADHVVRFLVGVAEKSRRSADGKTVRIETIEVNDAPGYRALIGDETRVFVLQMNREGLVTTVFAQSNPAKLTGVRGPA